MIYTIREKVVGYRSCIVQADTLKEAKNKWERGDAKPLDDFFPDECELIDIYEEW